MINREQINTSNDSPIPGATLNKPLKKKNRLPLIIGFIVFLLVALAGVGISYRQFLIRDTVAPTAPEESQANIDKIQSCSLSFNVAPPETGIICTKMSFRDELSNTAGEYDLVAEKANYLPGEIVVYSFMVTNTGEQATTITTSDSLISNSTNEAATDFEFLDSDCGADAYADGIITCTTDLLNPGDSQVFTFRVKISDQIIADTTITNTVEIFDAQTTNTCSVDIDVSTQTVANCNDSCTADSDCVGDGQSCIEDLCRLTDNPESEVCAPIVDAYCGDSCDSNSDCTNPEHICQDNECRLFTNPSSESCEEAELPTPTPATSPTPTPVSSTKVYCGEYCSANADCLNSSHICYFNECRLADYPDRADCSLPEKTTPITYVEPTPAIGCNESCLTNKDCSNGSHICYESKCRLDSYPASTSCTIPANTTQPKMPEELPQSGSEDLINWIKAGIGILGAGALLLLL